MTHEARMILYGTDPNPSFSTREEYLAQAAAWKKEYGQLSEHIRLSKKSDRLCQSLKSCGLLTEQGIDALPEDQKMLVSYPSGNARALRDEATQMLWKRHQMKAAAQVQYLAQHRQVLAA